MPQTDAAPREAYEISEAIAVAGPTTTLEEVLQTAPDDVRERVERMLVEATARGDDPTLVPLHIIRPGIGRGKGRHLYEADMLEQHASIFRGWRQYVDHLSEAARKALGGLPRSVRDLGGRIVESWWDGSVPPDEKNGWGQGAIVGLSRPVPYIGDLVKSDPELIEASISARATSVRPGKDNTWIVEGIEPRGTVDWVTEAGAGGRVAAALQEARVEDFEESLYGGLTLDELAEHRPDLVEEAKATDDDGDGDDEEEEMVKELLPKFKGNRAMAVKAARRKLARKQMGESQEGEDDVPLTAEALREALSTDEGQELLDELLEARIDSAVAEKVQEILPEKIEEALEEEREMFRIEARADADRQLQLRDLRDQAVEQIAESKLPAEFQEVVRGKFALNDSGPAPGLDVIDEVNDRGEVVKTASQVLQESVSQEIEAQRRLLAAANPTRVQAPPTQSTKDGEEKEVQEGEERKPTSTGSPLTDMVLQEAGFDSEALDKVYG